MSPDMILTILREEFKGHGNELDHKNDFELLIAVILSAQATDASVNKVTPSLFEKYPSPVSLSQAELKDVEKILQTLGLYKNKARFIIETSKIICENFNGQVPRTREALMTLPGVGRKTANVMLAVAYNIPAIAVDTHVARVAKRLGFAKEKDSVDVIEKKLMKVFKKEDWAEAHFLLLLFGRYISTARNKEDAYVLLEGLKEKYKL